MVLGVDGIADFNALQSRKHDEEVQLYAFNPSDGRWRFAQPPSFLAQDQSGARVDESRLYRFAPVASDVPEMSVPRRGMAGQRRRMANPLAQPCPVISPA